MSRRVSGGVPECHGGDRRCLGEVSEMSRGVSGGGCQQCVSKMYHNHKKVDFGCENHETDAQLHFELALAASDQVMTCCCKVDGNH